ncbi:hypothetical protein [Clostridium tyrobutyricum]|uniref:hypothetical protein n=1 Tax=Clostridium tyrobutyricum TaxID=1519 RepID=UPI0034A0CFC7
MQAKELFILDDKGDAIEGNNSLTNIKKNNSNEYIMEFALLNKDMKYKIGTNDLGYYEIRDDLKFKINLTK